MDWTPELDAELDRKLDPAHVKTRQQGGSSLTDPEGLKYAAEMEATA